MSSDLLEDIDTDENDCTVSISMNASGTAFLQVVHPEYTQEYYVLTPDEKGISNANKIANALIEWVEHTKAGLNV